MDEHSLPPVVPIPNRSIKDITGKRFSRLVVVGYVRSDKYGSYWLCKCDCGQHHVSSRQSLVRGDTQSCGCLMRERGATMSAMYTTTHGMSNGHPEYTTWAHMRYRCTKPSNPDYQYYGGRGIKVCANWNNFENFYADMGPRPGPKYSIDRIDTNGNYSCGHCPECKENGWLANCRWATQVEQKSNMRSNNLLTHNGETLTLYEWSRRTGIKRSTISGRINRLNWTVERALTEPPNPPRFR